MNSALTSVSFGNVPAGRPYIAVHRGRPFNPDSQCEICNVSMEEAWLICHWASEHHHAHPDSYLDVCPTGFYLRVSERKEQTE